ncbi:MAG: LysE family transporter [Kofleriaceae bacterium]
MLAFFLIGFAAGVITGVPIGPVNVAVIDAAYRHTLRRALSVGTGGAIADGLYCILGVAGISPKLHAYPVVPAIMHVVSGLVLVVYGFLTVRSQPVVQAQHEAARAPNVRGEVWSGFKIGVTLIVLNPAALVTWVVVVAKFVPDATYAQGMVTGGGVAIGSFAWFAFVAVLTVKGKRAFGDKARWLPRVVGAALIGYGLYLLGNAVYYFVT